MNSTILPLVLVIFDGWGVAPEGPANAIALADTPNFDRLWTTYPHTVLKSHGLAVGLPEGSQGSSEAGHLTLGAGRIVYQPAVAIDRALEDGSFGTNRVLNEVMGHSRQHTETLHLIGLVSDGGVHSSFEHLLALISLAKAQGVDEVFVHVCTDGRDVLEKSAATYVQRLEEFMAKEGIGRIASIQGRFYGMDRDTNWDRTEQAYALVRKGRGHQASSALEGIDMAYARGDLNDQFIQPTVITEDGKPIGSIQDNDSVIFFNFRADRARQLTAAFISKNFSHFPVDHQHITYVGLTQFDASFDIPAAFPQSTVEHNLAQVLSREGLRQLRIAETEKYAHVTYFFNSQVEQPVENEKRILVPSEKVEVFSQAPNMKSKEIADQVVQALGNQESDIIILNLSNTDLVGHTGDMEAVLQATVAVDVALGRIVEAALAQEGTVMITADHGNAEQMLYSNGEICPAHTLNPVPCIVVSSGDHSLRMGGGLEDVAPTILDLLDISPPTEMTGRSLLQ